VIGHHRQGDDFDRRWLDAAAPARSVDRSDRCPMLRGRRSTFLRCRRDRIGVGAHGYSPRQPGGAIRRVMEAEVLRRGSGILLHPTSLPGPDGIGDLGDGAYRFVDWLAQAQQRYWQVM